MRTHSIFHDKKICNSIYVPAKQKQTTPLIIPNKAIPCSSVKTPAGKSTTTITAEEYTTTIAAEGSTTTITAEGYEATIIAEASSEVENTFLQSLLKKALLPNKLFAVAAATHKLPLAGIENNFIRNFLLEQPLFTPKYKVSFSQKKAKTNRVSVVFTSLEVENINIAISIFQKYLANLTNKLLNSSYLSINCPSGPKSMGLLKRLKFIKLSPVDNPKSLSLLSRAKQRQPLENNFMQTSFPSGGGKRFCLPLINSKKLLPLRFTKSKGLNGHRNTRNIKYLLQVGVLEAVRSFAQKRLTSIPQKAQLYTVIRSPHVFKKTREQFATQQYKRVIKLDFTSVTAFRLFTDTVVLLKLPAEIKVITHIT